MAIRTLAVWITCALLGSCKLQKANLRSSEGRVGSTVPVPKTLVGTFVVKLAGKGKVSTLPSDPAKPAVLKPGSKLTSVAAGPVTYAVHYSFLLNFSEDGREVKFSSCLDSDADAAKTEGISINGDDALLLTENLRFANEAQSEGPTEKSSLAVFATDKVQCAKEQDLTGGQLLLAESAPSSPSGPTGSPTSDASPKAEAVAAGNLLKYLAKNDSNKETQKPNIEVQIRANSEGWQIDSFRYFGYDALIEQVAEK